MRITRLVVAVAAISLLAAACARVDGDTSGAASGGESSSESSDDPVEVFSWWTAGGEADGLEAMLAVIGGASLSGGRGSIWSALMGRLVVGSLANGPDLLGVSSALRPIATGVVLILAVGLDTWARAGDGP